ncbi:hypothetical protein GCM10012284_10550 [Mangrovihabitans endophyticus]|uniref:Uncharacterized protein n=1 Tax=Mangrovihabitans endophyticus TaxID=1751298 RepID=A0A8J3FMD1_9ACTN|nr:hypothetical protein GCM10012284_10550 [Mangrovihabitans endophyticus]
MDKAGPVRGAHLGEQARAVAVDRERPRGLLGVRLDSGDGGVRGAVDHDLGAQLGEDPAQRPGVGDVQGGAVQPGRHIARERLAPEPGDQVAAEHSAGPGDKPSHRDPPPAW